MAPDGVGAILNGDVRSLEQLGALAPDVTKWLLESLGQAHEDQALKRRLKDLLGNQFYISNLQHFGLWDDLQQKCSAQALEMGQEMKAYFEEHRLGEVLGKAYPNVAGRVTARRFVTRGLFCVDPLPMMDLIGTCPHYASLHRDTSAPLTVQACDESDCSRRLDDILPLPFEQDARKSPLWNEMAFIHLLRMIAAGIEAHYEEAVESVSERCRGAFRATAIKGYGRMANKCISKDDHYDGAYPRCVVHACAWSVFRIGKCVGVSYSLC